MQAAYHSYGPTAMADEDVCRAVGEDLTAYYPGIPWMVGCNHEAGVLHIDLPVTWKPQHLANHGYLMHIATAIGPDGRKKVMRAGGEMLERFGLRRGAAPEDAKERALEHGLITDGEIKKSRF